MKGSDKNDTNEIRLDEKPSKNESKSAPPLSHSDISTLRTHSMDYFTREGFILRTGYTEMRDWYLLPIREALDNGIDFVWKYCQGENIAINVDITKDDKLFHVKIRNPNPYNVPVFEDLDAIFNYEARYGSKQDVHVISRGMLGDAMKQISSLGYTILNADYDGTEFEDKQWDYPLIIRHNSKEYKIFLRYIRAKQEAKLDFQVSATELDNTDTEIDVTLPIIDEVRQSLNRSFIERFCRKHTMLTSDISFKFRILDDSTQQSRPIPDLNADPFTTTYNKSPDLFTQFVETLSNPSPKGILNIDIPAIHPIATKKEWNNLDSVYSHLPGEFTSRITNVNEKESTTVYDVLIAYREGTNIRKNQYDTSISKLLSNPNYISEIETFYKKLTDNTVLPPVKELSLPYTTNRKDRLSALIPSIAKLYKLDLTKKMSYRVIRGTYNDDTIQYPYAFEIIAIPLAGQRNSETEFIGAVNYSVSPNNIKFEGDYDIETSPYLKDNIDEVLKEFGFHTHSERKSRLPCIIIGNLVTPRRDPHGYDKSRIDIQPFAETIIEAVRKAASDIQTLHAVGFIKLRKEDNYKNARQKKINRKVSAKELLRQFLVKERGLPNYV